MTTSSVVPTRTTPHSPLRAHVPLVAASLMLLAGVVLSGLGAGRVEVEDVVDGAMLLLFPAVGGMLLTRGRVPTVARLFQAVGLLAGAGFLAGGAAEQDWAGRSAAGVLGSVGFVATISVLLCVTPYFFPDGRLPGPRWRPVVVVAAVNAVLACATVLLMPGPVDEDSAELGDNPMGVAALEPLLSTLEGVTFVVFAVTALLAVASLLLRLRGADRRTRQQVGTLGVGFAVLVGLFLLDSTLQALGGQVYGVVAAVVALGAVPVAAAIALLRD